MVAAFDALSAEDSARYAEVVARGAAAGPVRNSSVFAWIMEPIARPQRIEIAWLVSIGPGGEFGRCTELERGESDRVVVCYSATCADVAAAALQSGEPWAILAHVHPRPRWLGGGAAPSHADAELTRAVGDALARKGLGLLDHVILHHDEHYSFTEGRVYQGHHHGR